MNRHLRRAKAATSRAHDRSDPLDVQGRAARLARANAALFSEMRAYRDVVDQRQSESPLRESVTCKTGCAACCNQAVLAELAEAQIIVARHPKTVARLLQKLVGQVARIASAISDADMASLWMSGGSRKRHAATDAYWNLRMPCAFLEGGKCSVYDDRPNACRTHFVSSDPAGFDTVSDSLIIPGRIAPFCAGSELARPRTLGYVPSTAETQQEPVSVLGCSETNTLRGVESTVEAMPSLGGWTCESSGDTRFALTSPGTATPTRLNRQAGGLLPSTLHAVGTASNQGKSRKRRFVQILGNGAAARWTRW